MRKLAERKKIRIGDVYDEFTVIGECRITRKRGCRVYPCKCSCGREIDVASSDLGSGRKKQCGCLSLIKSGENHKQFTGKGSITGDWYSSHKSKANQRGYVWDVSIEFLWDLLNNQNFKCALSGVDIMIQSRYRGRTTASLDRINSNIGYTEGNVQWVHKDVNKMKNVFNQEYFINMCNKISKTAGGACELK